MKSKVFLIVFEGLSLDEKIIKSRHSFKLKPKVHKTQNILLKYGNGLQGQFFLICASIATLSHNYFIRKTLN